MSRRSLVVLGAALLAATSTASCFRRAFPVKSQYVISVERSGPPRVRAYGVLRLSRVSAAAQYDRKSFVYRTGDLTYGDDFYNTFYVPPTHMVSSIAARWLEDSGLFSAIVDAGSLASTDRMMEIRLTDLYIDRRGDRAAAAVVGMEVTLFEMGKLGSQAVLERRYFESEPTSARDGDAFVAAWGEALKRALARLEDDLSLRLAR